jgi:hypothetical protein
LDSPFNIHPSKFQALFNESLLVWKGQMVPSLLRGGYTAKALERNYIVDIVRRYRNVIYILALELLSL